MDKVVQQTKGYSTVTKLVENFSDLLYPNILMSKKVGAFGKFVKQRKS